MSMTATTTGELMLSELLAAHASTDKHLAPSSR